jgi:endo-1,4-beta-xylanase
MRSSSIAVFSFVLLSGYPAQASVIATYDFEDGTVQGWTSFNNASAPFNSTAEAFSGTHSLLTSVNSTGENSGPSISLNTILLPGATYTITGELRLTPGESTADVFANTANFTILRHDPLCPGSPGTCFDTIGSFQVPVNDSSWTQIGVLAVRRRACSSTLS